MSIYHNLEATTEMAKDFARKHGCNYNIIIMNHVNGEFDEEAGSTYEIVRDSYFEKERPFAIKITDTDTLLAQ